MTRWIAWTADAERWEAACRAVNDLLARGAAVYEALEPIETDGRTLPLGAFAAELDAEGQSALAHHDVSTTSLASPPGGRLMRLSRLRVALYGGGGAPFHHLALLSRLGFDCAFVTDQHVREGFLEGFDALVFPGGGWQAMHGQLNPLGEAGAEQVVAFVRRGGLYLGSCAGSYDAAVAPEAFTDTCPAKRCMNLIGARVWNCEGEEWVGLESPGVGVWRVRNANPDHPVMAGLPETFELTHYNGPLFEPTDPPLEGASAMLPLAALDGLTEAFTPAEHFLAPADAPLEDTLAARGAREGKGVVVAGHLGLGRVVLFGSHPEFGADAATLTEWGVAARMLANALFWQAGCHRELGAGTASGHRAPPPLGERTESLALDADLKALKRQAAEVLEQFDRLRERAAGLDRPWWLDPRYSLSLMGLSPEQVWDASLGALPAVADRLDGAVDELLALSDRATPDALVPLRAAIHYERAAAWGQDAGYQGVRALLRGAGTLVELALRGLEAGAPDLPVQPYEHFDRNPYYLAAGTYLSAVSVFLSAQLVLEGHAAAIRAALARERGLAPSL